MSIVSARRWNLQTLRLNLAGGVAVTQQSAVVSARHMLLMGEIDRVHTGRSPRGTTEEAETTAIGNQNHLPHCTRPDHNASKLLAGSIDENKRWNSWAKTFPGGP